MNRKLIIGGLVVTALSLWGFLACSVVQPNEGCAIESGSNYWAKYTITSQSGNCAFFQTYDPNGNLLTDNNNNWISGEEIAVSEYGPDQGPILIQFVPESLLTDTPDGGFAIGTLGTVQLNGQLPTVCDVASMSPSGQIVADPNFGLAVPAGANRGTPPADPAGPDGGAATATSTSSTAGSTAGTSTGGSTAGSVGGSTSATAGSTAGASSGGSSGSLATGSTTGAGSAGSSGSGSSGVASAAAAASSASATSSTGGGPAPVVITYSFSNVAFQQAYSILGKQFSATLNYTQISPDPTLATNTDPTAGGTFCNATIDVEAVQYHDNAVGQPGHLSGDHCEQDTNGDGTDCANKAAVYGFPVSQGWRCQPFGNVTWITELINAAALSKEEYSDGGTALPDGGLIPFQRCVPAGDVPVGALND